MFYSLGGGLLGALGTHMFDNVSWLLGQRIVAVNSSLRTVVKERPEGEGTFFLIKAHQLEHTKRYI